MFSIYTSAFNLIKNKFAYRETLENFSSFANEVCVAVNTSEDGTLEELQNYADENYKVKIIPCDISYDDPWLDGKVKDVALQATTKELKIGLDMDERLPLWQRDMWLQLGSQFQATKIDALFIHTLNLWGDVRSVQSDLQELYKFKWYLHKGGFHRGPVNFGRKSDGTIDITKSDSCELIDKDGNLAQAYPVTAKNENGEMFLDSLKTTPFVYHLGYANFQERDLRNKNFWDKHWQVECGKEGKFTSTIEEVSAKKVIPHNLPLWNEKL